MILQRRWIFLSVKRYTLNLLTTLRVRKIDYFGCRRGTALLKENETPDNFFLGY